MFLNILIVLVLPTLQAGPTEFERREEVRLEDCLAKIETAPEDAYEDSLAWLGEGRRPKARYCNAASLLALGRFEEGAARLETLAVTVEFVSVEDRALYFAQAGNAWLTAEYPDAAVKAFDEALKLDPANIDLFKDRAAAYLALKKWSNGIDDLNRALSLSPSDVEAVEMRARANYEKGDLAIALNDVETAMALAPENIDILVLRGDIREAMRLEALD